MSLVLWQPKETEIQSLRLELRCLKPAIHGALYILKHEGRQYQVHPQKISGSNLILYTVSTAFAIEYLLKLFESALPQFFFNYMLGFA